MEESPTTEQTARAILGLFKQANKRAGEAMLVSAITIMNMQIMHAGTNMRGADVQAGLQYAIKQGWLERAGSEMRLTEAGFKRM